MWRTVILPVVLYGCESWSVTMTGKHRLKVFEKRVLRRIFWPKGEEVTGEWRKLHSDELNDLYWAANVNESSYDVSLTKPKILTLKCLTCVEKDFVRTFEQSTPGMNQLRITVVKYLKSTARNNIVTLNNRRIILNIIQILPYKSSISS